MFIKRAQCLAACLLLTGCSHLLPRGNSEGPPGVPFGTLDAGIRECILAHQECHAYEFHFAREAVKHEGGFLLDFLSFRRTAGEAVGGLVAR